MYLRLVITRRDRESARKQGVFVTAYALLNEGSLAEAERAHLADLLNWFEEHLPLPDRSKLEPRSIFWLRSDSDRIFRRMWEIVAILREYGFHVELLKTANPGLIRYQDAHQVAATPYRDGRIE